MRVVEQPFHKGVLRCRCLVSEHTRQQPGYRIDYGHRRNLPAAQDKVTERQLLVDLRFYQSLVDAFVPACQQYDARQSCKSLRRRLVE